MPWAATPDAAARWPDGGRTLTNTPPLRDGLVVCAGLGCAAATGAGLEGAIERMRALAEPSVLASAMTQATTTAAMILCTGTSTIGGTVASHG